MFANSVLTLTFAIYGEEMLTLRYGKVKVKIKRPLYRPGQALRVERG